MSECECDTPRVSPNPRANGFCGACGKEIARRWTSNDTTVDYFFRRLAAATFPGKISDDFKRFRIDCEAREFAGRDKFGHSFLARDNAKEGMEEACDLALYAMLDTLKAVRAGIEEDDYEMALIAAHHAYKAYGALLDLQDKRRGAPGLHSVA